MAGPHRRSAEPLVRDLKGCDTVRGRPALNCGNVWHLTGSSYRGQSRRFYRPSLLAEANAGDQGIRRPRRRAGPTPSAMRPWASVSRGRTATDGGIHGHGRREWERLSRPSAQLLAFDLVLQDAFSLPSPLTAVVLAAEAPSPSVCDVRTLAPYAQRHPPGQQNIRRASANLHTGYEPDREHECPAAEGRPEPRPAPH